jgi:hypothetical protein
VIERSGEVGCGVGKGAVEVEENCFNHCSVQVGSSVVKSSRFCGVITASFYSVQSAWACR